MSDYLSAQDSAQASVLIFGKYSVLSLRLSLQSSLCFSLQSAVCLKPAFKSSVKASLWYPIVYLLKSPLKTPF